MIRVIEPVSPYLTKCVMYVRFLGLFLETYRLISPRAALPKGRTLLAGTRTAR